MICPPRDNFTGLHEMVSSRVAKWGRRPKLQRRWGMKNGLRGWCRRGRKWGTIIPAERDAWQLPSTAWHSRRAGSMSRANHLGRN